MIVFRSKWFCSFPIKAINLWAWDERFVASLVFSLRPIVRVYILCKTQAKVYRYFSLLFVFLTIKFNYKLELISIAYSKLH